MTTLPFLSFQELSKYLGPLDAQPQIKLISTPPSNHFHELEGIVTSDFLFNTVA